MWLCDLLDKAAEQYCLICRSVCNAVQGVSTFYVCGWNPSTRVTIQMKATEEYSHAIMPYKMALTFTSMEETLVCYHKNKSYWAGLLCRTVY